MMRIKEIDIIKEVALEKVDQIICYGNFETEIKYYFASKIRYAYKKELKEAIQLAHEHAKAGNTVLFFQHVTVIQIMKTLEKEGHILNHL